MCVNNVYSESPVHFCRPIGTLGLNSRCSQITFQVCWVIQTATFQCFLLRVIMAEITNVEIEKCSYVALRAYATHELYGLIMCQFTGNGTHIINISEGSSDPS